MPLRNATPLKWRPAGLSDALDGTNSFPGAMSVLRDLIPDPSTRGVHVCRPAAIQQETFAELDAPSAVTLLFVIGDMAYGMIGTGRFPGRDEPFAFNILTRTLASISGVTIDNVPYSPLETGDWTPPTVSALSTFLVVTHPGFKGNENGFIGWFDLSVPGHVSWSSGNLQGNPLIKPPSLVNKLGGRLYYAVDNALVASDAQIPLKVTNANQVLFFGSSTPITAMAGVPLNNQLGGVVQSLMVFKESEQGSVIFQLTGDYTGIPSVWDINELNVSGGTVSQNSICTTPYGIAMIDHDGLRILDVNGNLGDPIGGNGDGIAVPFQNAVAPTRICAAFNRNVYRVTIKSGKKYGNPFEEYWFDFVLKAWSGPHSFPYALIAAWRGTFLAANAITPDLVSSRLWRTDVRPSPVSTYIENGQPMTFDWQTVLLPDNHQMKNNCVIETNIEMSFIGGNTVTTVTASDPAGSWLAQVVIDPAQGQQTIWGNFQWGNAKWGGTGLTTTLWDTNFQWDGNNWDGDLAPMSPWRMPWPEALVFRQMKIEVTGQSSAGFRIGNLFMNYQILGYQQQTAQGVN
jgi:hypothetical protein